MRAPFKFYEATGEYEMIKVTDYWCPSEQRWSLCPSPCPDGSPHEPTRTKRVRSQLMCYVGPGVTEVHDGD